MITLIPEDSFKCGYIQGRKAATHSISLYLKREALVLPSPISEVVNMLAILVQYDQYNWHSVSVGPPKEPDPAVE